ncbi:probable VTC4-Vacuolar Transporter Chaperone [Serendipita indica DSM 11827]|uniref:Vacuolar transporter chaperone complex subunit 4 n=1 Tax=Serendipita indica (strain DSM 11827) TaxID=1109443 RepID=G4U3C5_SERID|nr:probable VTC4-Vacuolar Transporter Chaperone [Serendipita indica DSM 11827]
MKFGRKIKTDVYNEWREHYIDYAKLKKYLKEGNSRGTWTQDREQGFIQLLEGELEKIQSFQASKVASTSLYLLSCAANIDYEVAELAARIRQAENEVKQLVEGYPEDENEEDHPSDPNNLIYIVLMHWKRNGASLEETVAILVADVHDLALYTKLNFTGFVKIVKKHDKRTGLSLKATFVRDYLEKRPFYKYNWDALIVKLSRLYDLVRTRGHPVQGDSSAGGAQSAFVRQTTKYWVHPDNLVHLKLQILRHLPVLVFNPNKEFEPADSAITSIYFDNEDLELYLGRVEKTEGAEAIRLRWYGDMNVKTIFVERKTHREDWTGEKSVKARFPIKEDKVNAFIRGEYTMDAEFEALFEKGKKTRAEVDSMIQLAQEVQYAIITRKLQPVMRTFYNRTAFQLPGDARVRISLDTELTMVREDNWDGDIRSGSNWRRMDIGIDHPFNQLRAEDRELFPYGVLEVKLQTQFGQEPPLWVRELVSSHLVESIPKFSKFIHGCATLLPHRVDLVPFWLPQMDIDIRKPDTGNVTIDRPTPNLSNQNTDSTSTPNRLPSPHHMDIYTEPVSEGEEDEDMAVGVAMNEVGSARVPLSEALEAIAYREKELRRQEAELEARVKQRQQAEEEDADERQPFLKKRRNSNAQQPIQTLSINPLAPASEFDKSLQKKLKGTAKRRQQEEEEAETNGATVDEEGDTVAYIREFVAQPGKRIAVPVRVEPKVFFAQERTFLKWLHFAVLIGTVATALLNFSKPGDRVGLICAGAFTFSALASIAYAAGMFYHRTQSLRARSSDARYYDPYGPTALCIILAGATIINFVYQWPF